MAFDTKIVGTTTGNGAEVNASNQLKVIPETNAASNPGNVGAVREMSEVDAGTVTGTPRLVPPEASPDYRLRVAVDSVLFEDRFQSGVQNTNLWSYVFNTLTVTSNTATGTLNFSTVQGTTSSHGAYLRTYQYFPLISGFNLYLETNWGQFTAAMVSNEVWSCGFGNPGAATTLPTDGAWFQLTSTGLIGRVFFSSAFTDTAVLKNLSDFAVGSMHRMGIQITDSKVYWWMDDTLLAVTTIPTAQGQFCLAPNLPVFYMKHNTGAVSNTNIMKTSNISVMMGDADTSKPWSHQRAIMGLGSYVGANGGLVGKTTAWVKDTAPTAAAAVGTAGIAGALTLGGIVSVLPTLTANNDGLLFNYVVPAATVNIPGRTFVCTGIKIQGGVTVVLAGGPVLYAYFMAFGYLGTTLAATETGSFVTATTHHPRIVFVGMETYAANAAVGTLGSASGVYMKFDCPIVVRPGESIGIVARNMGVVTTTGAITVGCVFDGYWE